jgi:hypothetical protein
VSFVETRELSSERHTESDLDLGESTSPEPGSGPQESRLPLGLSVRGLQGTAVVIGFVAIVTAAVIGGALAVDSVARGDGNRPDGSAVLNDGDFSALPPSPSSAAEHPKTDGAKSPKDPKSTTQPKATDAAKKTPTGDSAKKSGGSSSAKSTTPDTTGGVGTTTPHVREAAPLAEMGVIRNLTTGQCVDLPDSGVPAAGSAINEYTCTPGTDDNQDFQLVEQFGQVMIRNLKSNLCLDLPGTGRVGKETVVTVGYCQAGDSDNQMFRAQAQGAGYYLVNVKSGLCLDVSGATDAERDKLGQPLTLYTCSPDDDHVWTVS